MLRTFTPTYADPELLLIGLLHDALEREPSCAGPIRERLGTTLIEALVSLTPDHRLERRRRHDGDDTAFREKARRLPAGLLAVRLADRLHNLRELPSARPGRAERFLAELDDFYLPLARQRACEQPSVTQLHHALSLEFTATGRQESPHD